MLHNRVTRIIRATARRCDMHGLSAAPQGGKGKSAIVPDSCGGATTSVVVSLQAVASGAANQRFDEHIAADPPAQRLAVEGYDRSRRPARQSHMWSPASRLQRQFQFPQRLTQMGTQAGQLFGNRCRPQHGHAVRPYLGACQEQPKGLHGHLQGGAHLGEARALQRADEVQR